LNAFELYFELGVRHIADWKGYDHILFIIALCSTYSFADWKKLLLMVTSFTIGHTITLFVAAFDLVKLDADIVEFGIAVTIFLAGIINLTKAGQNKKSNLKVWVAGVFGLIHGLGFSRYYKMISAGDPWVSLPSFTLGIEAGQVAIVLIILILGWLLANAFKTKPRDWNMVLSGMVIGISLVMALERWTF
jgi:hypothetical protein